VNTSTAAGSDEAFWIRLSELYLQYLDMKADSRSLYGVSDRWVLSRRALWILGERRRRLWPNPTKLEQNQYRAMDCGWGKQSHWFRWENTRS